LKKKQTLIRQELEAAADGDHLVVIERLIEKSPLLGGELLGVDTAHDFVCMKGHTKVALLEEMNTRA
jgi:hypothetical protein